MLFYTSLDTTHRHYWVSQVGCHDLRRNVKSRLWDSPIVELANRSDVIRAARSAPRRAKITPDLVGPEFDRDVGDLPRRPLKFESHNTMTDLEFNV